MTDFEKKIIVFIRTFGKMLFTISFISILYFIFATSIEFKRIFGGVSTTVIGITVVYCIAVYESKILKKDK